MPRVPAGHVCMTHAYISSYDCAMLPYDQHGLLCAEAAALLERGAQVAAAPLQKPKRQTRPPGGTAARRRSSAAAPQPPPSRPSKQPGRSRARAAPGTRGRSAPPADQHSGSGRRPGPRAARAAAEPPPGSSSAGADGPAAERESGDNSTEASATGALPGDACAPAGRGGGASDDGAMRADAAKQFVDHVAATSGSQAGASATGGAGAEESDGEDADEANQTEVKRASNQWRRDYRALAARARQLMERRRQLAWARASLTAQFLTRRSRLAAQVALQRAAVLEAWADGAGML